jgi:hypothetical protein
VIQQGWPYTVQHAKREPSETGADKRGCTTPKHCENFLSSSVLTADDDSQTSTLIRSWLTDPFFRHYGWAFVESCNSTPQKQKGHPILIFDQPITDLNLWRECLKAFAWAYPRVDRAMTNPVCTFYNRQNSVVHLVNGVDNLCPFALFEHCILRPYRQQLIEERARFSVETPNHQLADSGKTRRANVWVQRAINNLLREIATAPIGQRHVVIRDKSKRIGHLLAAEWHTVQIANPLELILLHVQRNGYLQEHDETNTRQLVASGIALGSSAPASVPIQLTK